MLRRLGGRALQSWGGGALVINSSRCTARHLVFESQLVRPCSRPIVPVGRGRLGALIAPTVKLRALSTLVKSTSGATGGASASNMPKPEFIYPERLLVYHGGTGRTTFLACLKLTTLFMSIFFGLVVAPAFLRSDEDESIWKAGGVALCGAVPLAFVLYSTSPFVAFVHLRLPPFARQSRDLLSRYANGAENAQVDITTINIIGKPRVTQVAVSNIVPAKARFGLVNYSLSHDMIRLPSSGSRARPSPNGWRSILTRPVKKFSIQQNSRDAREGWVWNSMAAAISRRSSA